MPSQRVDFPGSLGHLLAGRLDTPDHAPRAWAVSPEDTVVEVDNARRIFESALHPKSFVALDGADHLLTRAADARFAASIISSWASRYLPHESMADAGA